MNTNGGRRGHGRAWLTAVMAVAMTTSTIGLVTPDIATAVTLGPLTTHMEIDGDKANAAGFDWNDIQDGTLPGGYVVSAGVVSAGVIAQTYQVDGPSITQSCGVQDADSVVDGSKLNDNPWPVQVGLPNSKNDICSGGAAVEAVNVNGAVHFLLYQYYTRTPERHRRPVRGDVAQRSTPRSLRRPTDRLQLRPVEWIGHDAVSLDADRR